MNLDTPISSNRHRWLVVAAALVVIALAVIVFESPAIADLSEENRHEVPTLKAQWQKGEVIVLVRHLERCDKEDAPCLVGTEGITERSVAEGQALGEDFYRLGLLNSDVYNSPLDRTAHSSCIDSFEESLGYSSETPEYGTSLFFSPGPNNKLEVHGFLEMEDWDHTLGF